MARIHVNAVETVLEVIPLYSGFRKLLVKVPPPPDAVGQALASRVSGSDSLALWTTQPRKQSASGYKRLPEK